MEARDLEILLKDRDERIAELEKQLNLARIQVASYESIEKQYDKKLSDAERKNEKLKDDVMKMESVNQDLQCRISKLHHAIRTLAEEYD